MFGFFFFFSIIFAYSSTVLDEALPPLSIQHIDGVTGVPFSIIDTGWYILGWLASRNSNSSSASCGLVAFTKVVGS